MQLEYTPEEVRALMEEHEPLEHGSATAADAAEATDILEGVEELVARLGPAVRRATLEGVAVPVGDLVWIPVVNNCSRSAGVTIAPDGSLNFAVRGAGEDLSSYFSARQAVAHALMGQVDADAEAGAEGSPEPEPEISPPVADEDPVVAFLKANGRAVAAGRTLADVDPEVLAAVHPLSEAGVAHLFAEGDGLVVAMAGSTAGDRRRAVEALATVPARGYSSRPNSSVLLERGEAGSHYSEDPGFGHVLKEAPRPRETELAGAAERFKAARIVRPSRDRPLDVEAIRRRVRRYALVRAAVRYALAADTAGAGWPRRRADGPARAGRSGQP
jgi:hypothetical protein